MDPSTPVTLHLPLAEVQAIENVLARPAPDQVILMNEIANQAAPQLAAVKREEASNK
jgi:hypothetical protein